jgi:hypothetical protein
VYFSGGSHGGPWVFAGVSLLYGYGRRQALYRIDVGFVHLGEKLACIRRKRFDVSSLTLRIYRVEGKRGLAGA